LVSGNVRTRHLDQRIKDSFCPLAQLVVDKERISDELALVALGPCPRFVAFMQRNKAVLTRLASLSPQPAAMHFIELSDAIARHEHL
jgi:hypothetical protein